MRLVRDKKLERALDINLDRNFNIYIRDNIRVYDDYIEISDDFSESLVSYLSYSKFRFKVLEEKYQKYKRAYEKFNKVKERVVDGNPEVFIV